MAGIVHEQALIAAEARWAAASAAAVANVAVAAAVSASAAALFAAAIFAVRAAEGDAESDPVAVDGANEATRF